MKNQEIPKDNDGFEDIDQFWETIDKSTALAIIEKSSKILSLGDESDESEDFDYDTSDSITDLEEEEEVDNEEEEDDHSQRESNILYHLYIFILLK